MIHRSCCVLFMLWLLIPTAFVNDFSANDIGLLNPAQRDFTGDFAEVRPNVRDSETFGRRVPAFTDRALPQNQQVPQNQQAGAIRQVSTTTSDPFSAVMQPAMQPVMPQFNPFDWESTATVVPNNHQVPHDFNPFGGHHAIPHLDPHAVLQYLHLMGMEQHSFPPFTPSPFAMQPPLHHQGFMMNGMHPHIHPHMMPYGNMHTMHAQFGQSQFGHLDPLSMGTGFQPGGGHNAHDPQVQQFLLMQEMARMQAEIEGRANGENRTGEARVPNDPNWTLNNLVPIRVTSPLAETMFVAAQTISPFSTPPGPDKGVGRPLVGTSWLDHPYYFGGFVGGMSGSELVSRMIRQRNGATGGLTLGYNFNDYWGLEGRLHFAAIDIRDTDHARQLFEIAWNVDNPDRPLPPWTSRTNQLTILDAAIHYYPLGNAKWRPYFKYGLGVGQQQFVNTFGFTNRSDVFTMPMGIGMRYWWNERLAIHLDLTNNTIFASGIAKTQNNVAFTMGLTYAFGNGRRTNPVHYWPVTPSMGAR